MIPVQKFKKLTVCALLGLLTTWIVSCSTGNTANTTNQTSEGGAIEFWTMSLKPKFNDYFQNLIASFESQNQGRYTLGWNGEQNLNSCLRKNAT